MDRRTIIFLYWSVDRAHCKGNKLAFLWTGTRTHRIEKAIATLRSVVDVINHMRSARVIIKASQPSPPLFLYSAYKSCKVWWCLVICCQVFYAYQSMVEKLSVPALCNTMIILSLMQFFWASFETLLYWFSHWGTTKQKTIIIKIFL